MDCSEFASTSAAPTTTSAQYSFAFPYPQKFSIPNSIIHYITKFPQFSNGYGKLQKTCKYFYFKNPIIIADTLTNWRDDGWKMRQLKNDDYKDSLIPNLFNDPFPYKIWVTRELFIEKVENISKLFSKIFRFDARCLNIQKQNLSLNELLFFSSSTNIENIWFSNMKIMNSDGSMVTVEKIFEIFPNILNFHYNCNGQQPPVTKDTVAVLLQNPKFKNIESFNLGPISEAFDFATFSIFMKEKKKTEFVLIFCNPLSQLYLAQLKRFFNQSMYSAKLDATYNPPMIKFPGINNQEIKMYSELRNSYIQKQRESGGLF